MNTILYTKLAFTGAVILGLELVASRVLTPFFGVSLDVWSSILAVTLIALAIGYKFGGYLSNRLSSSHMLIYFICSGSISAIWMNFGSYTYPHVLSELSTWEFVNGSIISCLYVLFIPLLIFSSLNSVLVAILGKANHRNNVSNDHYAGNVFFVSTIGSVVGVFIVSYSLLPNFSNYTSYAILAVISSLLTLFLALVTRGIEKNIRTVICIISILLVAIATKTIVYGENFQELTTFQKSSTAPKWTVISKIPSFYGNHTVVNFSSPNGTQWRGFLTSGLVNNQLSADGVSASVFTHALELLSFSGSTPPKDVLILGLGAGIVATNLKNMGANVEVIELDHIVEKIAREYFSFKGDDILVTIEDARTFVRTCQKKYDVVIVDLFRGDGIPSHVVSQEFFNDIKSCLHDDGAIVMNAFYGTKDLQSKKALLKTIVSVFGKIVVFETLTNTSAEMTSGYILARNREQWSYNISLLGKPEFVIKNLKRTFQNSTIYGQNSDLLKNTTPIYDNKNDWTRISSYIDTVYRKKLISHIPWQVLLD